MPDKTPLEVVRERRAALYAEIKEKIDARRAERSTFEARTADTDESKRPTEEERTAFATAEQEFNEDFARRKAELDSLDARYEQEEAAAKSLDIAQRASADEGRSPSLTIESEPMTYRYDNQYEHSYFLDMAAKNCPELRSHSSRTEGFEERLRQHAKEIDVEMPKRWAERERRADAAADSAEFAFQSRAQNAGMIRRAQGLADSPFERQARLEQRAPNRTPGQGGYAVPPLWLIDEYIPALRPGRVAAGLARNMPLPQGTDSINVPRLLTPTLTAIQGQDAAPVASRDFSDTFQQANVKTIAGQEDVPVQLLEQAPNGILDRVLMNDLIADYNQKLDLQVIQGSGVGAPLSGGQVVGMYPASNWGAIQVPWNNPSGALPLEYGQVLGAMASKTAYNRYNLQDFAYLGHPRRWMWYATGLAGPSGTSGNYIINTNQGGFQAFNVQGITNLPEPFEGFAGQVPWGPRYYIDANVPVTDGAGVPAAGTSDITMGAIWDDIWLFEGDLRTNVFTEVLSGTLEIRLQLRSYVALLCRYGQSISISYGSSYGQPYTLSGSTNGVAY